MTMHPEISAIMAELNRRFSIVIHTRNSELIERDSPETPFWYLNVFISLAHEAMKMQFHAKRAFQEGEMNYLAWAARNLLELRVWTLYATESRQNALRFHQDQFVDGLSALRSLEKSAQKLPREEDAQCVKKIAAGLRPQMEQHATVAGVDDSLPYLSPKYLAKQLNLEGEFEIYNVLCSKMLHSTGYSVLVAQNDIDKRAIMDSAFRYAATCAFSILDALNAHLKSESLPYFE